FPRESRTPDAPSARPGRQISRTSGVGEAASKPELTIAGTHEPATTGTSTPVQRRSTTTDEGVVPTPHSQQAVAQNIPSEQLTLPNDVRQAVSTATGQAPMSVPIRRGPAVAAQARALKADAFTQGGVIHAPGTAPLLSLDDRRLLAHEVTHLVQQEQHGSTLPSEATPAGQALERQALRSESSLAPTPGPVVPARRGEPRSTAQSPQHHESAAASSRGQDAAVMPSNNATLMGSGVLPAARSQPGTDLSKQPSSGGSSSPDRSKVGVPAALDNSRDPGSTPVAARSVPSAVPAARTLVSRTPTPSQVRSTVDAIPVVPLAPAAAAPVSAGAQRRASRAPVDATIGVDTTSQEETGDAAPRPASAGSRQPTGTTKDTARDQEWLMRHAQALYPLLRTMLRAELLRDHERRGHMLKENF
ncbi:MAG: DUF4157 domain-containing protein, partial [Actinomycetales bacterium]